MRLLFGQEPVDESLRCYELSLFMAILYFNN